MEHGIVEIILTDIIWRGEYTVVNKSVILTFEDNYEVPEKTMVFKFVNKSRIKRLDNNTIWHRMIGDSIWD